MVVFGQSGCIGAKWLNSGKVIVFRQKGLYSGKSGFYSGKVFVFGQNGCIREKLVVILQSGYLGKLFVFGQKWLY